ELRDDDNVWAVILTGAGRGFCSGVDLRTPRADSESPPRRQERLDVYGWVGRQAMAVYRTLDKPIIAAVNGVAAGAGMSLALSCDMRVGSELTRFKTVFIERSLSPDSGLSFFLPRIVGYSRAWDCGNGSLGIISVCSEIWKQVHLKRYLGSCPLLVIVERDISYAADV